MTHPSSTPADPATSTTAAPRRRRAVWTVFALAVAGSIVAAVVVLAGGAGATSDPATTPAVFVTQPGFAPGATVACLLHQTTPPDNAYQGGAPAQPVPQLTFLAYYTAAGTKPFCDAQPATDTDKAWAQLYVQLTTSPDNVTTILR